MLTGVVLGLLTGSARAQLQSMNILRGQTSVEIPFRRINNLILIKVLLDNAIPLEFLLDTGVRTPILTDRVYSDFLNMSYDRTLTLKGAGQGQDVYAHLANNVRMMLPNVQVLNQPLLVLQEDYLELANQLGVPVHGIIGYELFARFVVKIDYDSNLITLYEPKSFRAPRAFEKLPLHLEEAKPFIEAEVVDEKGRRHTLKLLLDTGASHALLLHADRNDIALPEKTLYGNLGRGLLGDITGHIGRLKELKIGSSTFKEVLASFPEATSYSLSAQDQDRSGTIGGEILGRFSIIIDYHGNALYLQKSSAFRDPFIFNKTGITFIAKGPNLNLFEVIDIRADSPAEKAGIQKGDILFKINGARTENIQLKDLSQILRRRDGKKVRFVFLRRDEKIKRSLRLKDLI
jgi:hypothetical protein